MKSNETTLMNRRGGLYIAVLLLSFSFSAAFLVEPSSNAHPLHPTTKSIYPLQKCYQPRLRSSPNGNADIDNAIASSTEKNPKIHRIFFDIAIPTNSEKIPIGRLTFHLTPHDPQNPAYLPLHTENIRNLAAGTRRSIDPKATYVGCSFAFSPAFIQDGSFRYRWSHECDGFGRNAIRAADPVTGELTRWEEAFSDPERLKDCTHKCFGGVYYGRRYGDVVEELTRIARENYSEENVEVPVVLLTVPIHGPKSGTSKFSIVRVGESPREWGERLLLNSAVIGYLDCSADGRIVEEGIDDTDDSERVNPMEVLRAMAQQRMGPPTIINCGSI